MVHMLVAGAGERHIQGWKEIASRLGRDERTAKRWEKQRGLPVRRIPGGGRANVYLIEVELEAWLRNALPPSSAPVVGETYPPAPHLSADLESTERAPDAASIPEVAAAPIPPLPSEAERLAPAPARRRFRWVAAAAIALALSGWAYTHTSASPVVGRLRHVPSPEVDQLYLRGVYLSEVRTADSLRSARSDFEQAIARDPQFASAHSGLAVAFLLLREYSTMPSAEAYTRAQAEAERAVALDPRLSEAHAALGFIDFFSLWHADDAAREFSTAIRLDPRNSTAHHWYGSMLMHQGHFAEALAQLDEAQHLHPTSNAILSTRALTLGFAGRHDEAAALLESLLHSDPAAPGPHRNLAYVSLTEPRDTGRFLREMIQFATMQQDENLLGCLRAAEAARRRGGDTAMWSSLRAQNTLPPGAKPYSMLRAEAEEALGESDAALADLDRMAQGHESALIGLVVSPQLRPLHHDPRFRRLAGTLGLQVAPASLAPSGQTADAFTSAVDPATGSSSSRPAARR